MYILGINAYHGDSSACLISNGELVTAVEEELIRRIIHIGPDSLRSQFDIALNRQA